MPTKLLNPLLFFIARVLDSILARCIEYLVAENQTLRGKLPKQIRATPQDRARLVELGKRVGPDLKHIISIVSYATFLSWKRKVEGHRPAPNPVGRPRKPDELRALIVRMARENPWGVARIHGELKTIGITNVSVTTIRNILKDHGLAPTPKRGSGLWDEFLKRHIETLWACDFVFKKIWTLRGHVDCFVLFVMYVASRRVHIVGVTVEPNRVWLAQQARNITLLFDDQSVKPRHLIHDRDGKFTPQFDAILSSSGCKPKRLPFASPNLNAHAERWVQSLRRECLDHFMIFGEEHMRYLCHEYVDWYNTVRPHRSFENLPLGASPPKPMVAGFRASEVKCEARLGGILKHYYRDAA